MSTVSSAAYPELALLDIQQVADHLRVSDRTIFSITKRGELPAVRIGRSVRYRPADVAAYCERLAQGGAA